MSFWPWHSDAAPGMTEETFKRYGQPLTIPMPQDDLAGVLLSLSGSAPSELAQLDRRVRSASPCRKPGESQWPQIGVNEMARILGAPEPDVHLLGLISFHQSGYIRELAVCRLTQITSGQELPYLLLRLNDWINPVSQAALKAVESRVTPQYADAFVRNILLAFNLAEQKRRQNGPVLSAVMDLLRRPECRATLWQGLAATEKQARRLCFHILREADDGRLLESVPQMLTDTDPVIRQAAAQTARVALPDDALGVLLPLMKRDSFVPVRRAALYACLERLPELAPAELHEALLDNSAAMRGIARYHLSQAGAFDVTDFYRRALKTSPVAALDGLGETGTAQDAERLLPYLSHPVTKVRRAAVKAVSRLDGDNHMMALFAALGDERPSVVHEAREALRPRLGLLGGDTLWRLFKTASQPHVRRDVLALLASLPKWESIPFLVEAAADEDPAIGDLAAKRLRGWSSGYNSSFVRPTQAQTVRLEEALRVNPDVNLTAVMDDWKAKNKI